MVLPEYPLEHLVIIKQKRLDEAEKHLKAMKASLQKEIDQKTRLEQERDHTKQHKEDKLQQFRETIDKGTTSDKIDIMKKYLKEVDLELSQREKKVIEQQKRVQAAEKKVEEARNNYIKKQHDIEKLSIHRKEWVEEIQSELNYKEAVEADELGAIMYSRNKKKK